eukprot:9172954-Alexandrium_andersonii.AAC.1
MVHYSSPGMKQLQARLAPLFCNELSDGTSHPMSLIHVRSKLGLRTELLVAHCTLKRLHVLL